MIYIILQQYIANMFFFKKKTKLCRNWYDITKWIWQVQRKPRQLGKNNLTKKNQYNIFFKK